MSQTFQQRGEGGGTLNVLDLFSGIGGFSIGLERAGFKTVAFCEIDPFCRKVLKKHWPDVPVYEDVRHVSKGRLDADGIGKIDVIAGGFPCQDVSVAGNQAGIGEGTRSGLWSELARIISEVRPEYAIVENVTALLSGDRGGWFGRILGDLAQIGYDAEWHCIPASYVGAPHNRDRVWIVANPFGSKRRQKPYLREIGRMGRKQQSVPWDGYWEDTLRKFRGMDDGTAYRVDRIDSLRNSIVPQIPEIIGRAIMRAEA